MPARLARKQALIQEFIQAIKLSGGNVLVLEWGHPARLSISRSDQDRIVVLLYIWNMTHGGYPRDPN